MVVLGATDHAGGQPTPLALCNLHTRRYGSRLVKLSKTMIDTDDNFPVYKANRRDPRGEPFHLESLEARHPKTAPSTSGGCALGFPRGAQSALPP